MATEVMLPLGGRLSHQSFRFAIHRLVKSSMDASKPIVLITRYIPLTGATRILAHHGRVWLELPT